MSKLCKLRKCVILLICVQILFIAGCSSTKALLVAAKEGDIIKVRHLIQKDVDVNKGDKYGNLPLKNAVIHGHKEIVALLISEGADVKIRSGYSSSTPLHCAYDERDIAALLISKGANIEAKDNKGRTPLHDVAEFGEPNVATLLISEGADINARDSNGQTPLHRAYDVERMGMVSLLLSKGADANAKDYKGRTPDSVKGLSVREFFSWWVKRDEQARQATLGFQERDYECDFETVWSTLISSTSPSSIHKSEGHIRTRSFQDHVIRPGVIYRLNIFVVRKAPQEMTVRIETEIQGRTAGYGYDAGHIDRQVNSILRNLDLKCLPKSYPPVKIEREEIIEPEESAPSPVESEEQRSPVELVLKFTPQETTTYRLARENDRSAEWEGPEEDKPKGFTGGHTGNRMEMIFTQKIQSVDDEGNAVAEIEIKSLKYIAKVKNNVTLDFDSSGQKDPNDPLNKLIGQSYTVELTPSGDVSKVIDAVDASAAVKGSSSGHKMAAHLLSEEAIKDRHAISALPDANEPPLRVGESWSSIKSFSFDLMGAKSYEKIYTLEEVRDIKDHRIALARMNAVPSAEEAKELHKEQATSAFSQMFDNTETFTGELKLDLTDGKVVEWREEMLIEWFIVDLNPDDDEQPAVLRMTAGRLASLERID